MPPLRCTVCNARNATECSVCKSAAYCSERCKNDDERLHLLVCKQFAAFVDKNPRPSEKAFIAIKLEPESKVPELVWVQGRNYNDFKIVEMGASFNQPVKHTFLGDDDPRPNEVRITSHSTPKFDLDHTVAFNFRDAFFYDGSKTNECVANMANGKHKHRWCGRLIVLAWPGLKLETKVYQDVTAADLHYVTDYFKSVGDGLGVKEELKIGDQPVDFEKVTDVSRMMQDLFVDGRVRDQIWGVVISCKGSRKFRGKPRYTPTSVIAVHGIFQLKATELSKAIKLPIMTYKQLAAPLRYNGPGWNPLANPVASAMNLNLQVLSDTWGGVDKNMWDDVGDIIVAREDHKDITMQQVEAIAQFALKVQKLVTKQVTAELADSENQDKKAKAALRCKFLQEEVSKEKFENFFVKYKVDKIKKKDKTWRGVVSPYST
jgi:hypothetical protein